MFVDPWQAKAFVVVQGNRSVGHPADALELAPFEDALGTGLRAGTATALWFENAAGARQPFEPWLAGLRAQGLREIALVPAVADLAPTLLALDLGAGDPQLLGDRWERETVAPPSARALLAFVRDHPGEGLGQRTAYYARELGLIEHARWKEVERRCAPTEDELWVEAFVLAQSHVDVSTNTAAEWEALAARARPSTKADPELVFAVSQPTAGYHARPAAPLAEARASLEQALGDNLALARAGSWKSWVTWFGEALERLHVPPPPGHPWVRITCGCGVPPEVLSLARAADKSHVFGGMGSWNDMPIDSAAERERLWQAMHGAWGTVFAVLTACATGRA